MSGHKGLDKWFKQDWVDIDSKKRAVDLPNVVDQNKKQTPNESIQSVSPERKLTG